MSRTAIPLYARPGSTTTVDPAMAQIASSIDRYGVHVIHVGESCACRECAATPLPPDQRFGYTIGLTDVGHPELLVRGLSGRESAGLLNRWGAAVLSGQVFDAGHLLCEGSAGSTWELVPVRRPSRTLLWAGRYYRAAGTGGLAALELIPARRPCPCEDCG